jgi:tetratricopeptide (TPR) repeat protein
MAMGSVEHIHGGDLDRLVEWAERGLQRWAAVGAWSHFYTLFGAVGLFRKGDWEEARQRVEVAMEHFPEGHWKGRVHALAFLIDAYMGRDGARDKFEAWSDRIPVPGRAAWGGDRAFALVATEPLAVMGEFERAAALYPVALETVENGIVVWETGLGHRYLGIAAACAGEWERAEEHFRTALRQAEEMPYRVEQPETRRWYAWMMIRRGASGDSQRARALLSEAIDLYSELGMSKHADVARGLL